MPVDKKDHMTMHCHMVLLIYRHIARLTRAERRACVARCSHCSPNASRATRMRCSLFSLQAHSTKYV